MCMWGHFTAAEKFLSHYEQFNYILVKNKDLNEDLEKSGRH